MRLLNLEGRLELLCPACRKLAVRQIKQSIPRLLKNADTFADEQSREDAASSTHH